MYEPDQPPLDGVEEPQKPKDYSEVLEKITNREADLKSKWHEEANKIQKTYLGDDADTVPFNILYSNTETIVPAVFSKKPVAKVLRRYDAARADVPAKAVQRLLSFSMDTNLPSYPNFMTAVEDAVLDAALPGQGQLRVRVVNKLPVLDYVYWDKYIWGFCQRWEDRGWEAFRLDMTVNAILETFGGQWDPLKIQQFKARVGGGADDSEELKSTNEKRPPTLAVYEYWDKNAREQHFLCQEADQCCLLSRPDPLGLENFFPTPSRPLTFIHSTTDTLPRPLYRLYKSQAQELNEITRRLKKVVQAIKVRGVYAGGLPEIAKIFSEDEDNTLIPSEASSQILTMQKGLDAYIWMIPFEKLVTVANELYKARDAVKGTIYEILGIGDILRGVSKASETLGAQEIKDKWGSLRINKVRERTAEFIRDGLRLVTEVAVKHTPPETWEQMTGMQLKSPAETMVLQQTQGAQPPDPMSTWPGVLSVLQNDLHRAYLIDVETNSTVDSEATTEKRDMAEFMTAFGQTMSGLAPLAQSSPEGFEMAKAVLIAVLSKYDLGAQIEPMLKALPVPKALQGPPPELQKAQEEIQKKGQELAKREEGLQKEEADAKEVTAGAQKAIEDMKAEQEKLQKLREQLRKDTDMALKEIEMARREASLKLKEEKMVVDAAKVAVNAQAKANQANRPNTQRAK